MADLVTNSGKRHNIREGVQSIGRDPNCDMPISGDGVSRRHAEIHTVGSATRVVDLNSTNGVFVNGTRAKEAYLKHADTLRLGDAVLTFEAESPVDHAISAIRRLQSTPEPGTRVIPGAGLDRTEVLGPVVGLQARLDTLANTLSRIGDEGISGKDAESLLIDLDLLRESFSESAEELDKARVAQERTTVLLAVSEALNSILHTDDLLAAIMDMALATVKAERGVLMLHDPASERLVPRITRSLHAAIDLEEDAPFSESIALRVFRTGETYASNDASKDFDGSESIVDSGIMSAICVPIRARGVTKGVLCVDTRRKRVRFSREDTALLEGIAAQASVALENAGLYDEIDEQKRNIESIINSMTDAVLVADADYDITFMNSAAKLIFNAASVKGANIKLRSILEDVKNVDGNCTQDIVLLTPEETILESSVTYLTDSSGARVGLIMAMRNVTEDRDRERTRAKFLNFVAHKLGEPLEVFRKEVRNMVESGKLAGDETAGMLRSNIEFFRELAIKLLYFAELAAGPLRLRRNDLDLVEMARRAADDMKSFCDRKKLTVSAPEGAEPVHAYVDEERFFQAIANLLLNAIAAAPPEGEIGCTVSADKKSTRLTVWDYGDHQSGTASDGTLDDKDLFIEDIIQTKTVGVGRSSIRMAFVHHIMDAHGGTVRVEKDEKNGRNMVTLEMPRWQDR